MLNYNFSHPLSESEKATSPYAIPARVCLFLTLVLGSMYEYNNKAVLAACKEQKLIEIKENTTMTDAQKDSARAAVLQLGNAPTR